LNDWGDTVRRALGELRVRTLEAPHAVPAAVLLPLADRAGEPYLLLTRRTTLVRRHKGQISLPGGVRESAESLAQTALRETEEELGIPPSDVRLLGCLNDYLSSSNYVVTPFVGLLEQGFQVRPNAVEVEELLEPPLRFFQESPPRTEVLGRQGRDRVAYFYEWGEHRIWGLTARIIKDFVDLLASAR
jgi:8-oxo-dGTP pyrophosphatase MutT (NUDIX family)